MNLLLAVIMDSFDSVEVQEEKEDIENMYEVAQDLDLNHQSIGSTFLAMTSVNLNGSNFAGSSFNQSSLNRSQTSSNNEKKKSSEQMSVRSGGPETETAKESDEIKDEGAGTAAEADHDDDNLD